MWQHAKSSAQIAVYVTAKLSHSEHKSSRVRQALLIVLRQVGRVSVYFDWVR